MTKIDIPLFREQFPEYKDEAKYPDAHIQFMADLAGTFIDQKSSPCRILRGDRLTMATRLMIAHLMALAAAQRKAGAAGKPGGGSTGFVTSSTVGEVSVAKLAPPVTDGWQWWLSGTPYGQQLWALLELLAVGGFTIGGLPEGDAFRKVGGVF